MSQLWGEIPLPSENKLNLSTSERESLCAIPPALRLEGSKIHQPTDKTPSMKQEPPPGDPMVLNTIQLLAYRRRLDRLLDQASLAKQQVSSGELPQMPALPPLPSMPPVAIFPRFSYSQSPFGYSFHEETDFTKGVSSLPVPSVGSRRARRGLYKAVATLVAHAGYQAANSEVLDTLTDVAMGYVKDFCGKMRSAFDAELEAAPEAGMGFPDVVERVAKDTGLGSVLRLQDYYEDDVVRYHKGVVDDCKAGEAEYRAELPGWRGGSVPQFSDHDDIPEMHFPGSEEGDGEGLLDHATPQLDAGMQMLQSLEASGELGVDTPMSLESEGMGGSVISMSAATPSPQVGGRVTPIGRTSSPQLGSARKRRKSGKLM